MGSARGVLAAMLARLGDPKGVEARACSAACACLSDCGRFVVLESAWLLETSALHRVPDHAAHLHADARPHGTCCRRAGWCCVSNGTLQAMLVLGPDLKLTAHCGSTCCRAEALFASSGLPGGESESGEAPMAVLMLGVGVETPFSCAQACTLVPAVGRCRWPWSFAATLALWHRRGSGVPQSAPEGERGKG